MIIVAGKGGVGKTTVCAAVARMASRLGFSTLVLAVEPPRGATTRAQSQAMPGPHAQITAGTEVFARLAPDAALVEYLEGHGLRRLSRRLARSGAVEIAATAAPGIKDVLMLGKVRQLESAAAADLILVDAQASGHAVRFMAGARGLAEIVGGGPLRVQADEVTAMLTDPRRCRVLLVAQPEETPVNEVTETAFALEDQAGVALDSVVINGLYPPIDDLEGADPLILAEAAGVALDAPTAHALAEAARFRARRQELQAAQVARLAARLPLPQLELPFLFKGVDRPEPGRLVGAHGDPGGVGGSGIDLLADALRTALGSGVDRDDTAPGTR